MVRLKTCILWLSRFGILLLAGFLVYTIFVGTSLHRYMLGSQPVSLLSTRTFITPTSNSSKSKFNTMTKPALIEYSTNMITWVGNSTTPPGIKPIELLINPTNLCKTDGSLNLLILVNSALQNLKRRDAIRDTYGQYESGFHGYRVLFLLGTTHIDHNLLSRIHDESSRYGDILQGDFIDSYHNLTLKGVMGLKWVSEFCSNAKIIIKADDDVVINVKLVESQLLPYLSKNNVNMACSLQTNGTSKIFRNKGQKWYVDDAQFTGFDAYPFEYCNGYFVVLTADIIRPLYKATKVTPFFWVDDAYLFGMLPAMVSGVTFKDIMTLITADYAEGALCLRRQKGACPMYALKAGHREAWKVREFYTFWNILDE